MTDINEILFILNRYNSQTSFEDAWKYYNNKVVYDFTLSPGEREKLMATMCYNPNDNTGKGYEDYITIVEPWLGGVRKRFEFPNGYGASLVRHTGSYGGDEGLWELGVIRDSDLVYDTPITNDVLGYLTDKEVNQYLEEIKNLPKAD